MYFFKAIMGLVDYHRRDCKFVTNLGIRSYDGMIGSIRFLWNEKDKYDSILTIECDLNQNTYICLLQIFLLIYI